MTKEQQIKIQRCIDEFYFNRPQVRDELGAALQVLYEAEPVKHGRWKVLHGVLAGDDIYGDMGECSNCGLHLRNYEWDYCPNCGTKMDLTE